MRISRRVAIGLAGALLVAGCSSSDNSAKTAEVPPTVDSPVVTSTTTPTSTTEGPNPPSTSPVPTSAGDPASYCSSGPFSIDEQRAAIVDPAGVDFLPVGINLTTGAYQDGEFWEKTSVTDLTPEHVATLRDVWRFNTVRLNIDSNQLPDIWTSAELERVIGLFTDAGMVAMVENHPYGTGLDPTAEQIESTANGFAELARRWADNGCVWFNPFNEPGGKRGSSVYDVNNSDVTVDDAWVDWHTPVIDAIRAVSPDAVVVLDDTHFGQGRAGREFEAAETAVLTYGPDLNSRYDNLLYSVHFYDRWGGIRADMDAFFDGARQAGLAVVVGEAGGHPTEGPFFTDGYWPTSQTLFEMRQPGVGILLWHGRTGHQSGMSVSRDQGQRVAVWEVTDRDDTEASGRLMWDWAHDPPSATP
ncbi:MAG: cellulase family glycosylhydrolase [Acidimicrobiales bacterium]